MTINEIGEAVGREFLPLYEDLTTSDLQACISAAVAEQGLSGGDAAEAENVALKLIYTGERHGL